MKTLLITILSLLSATAFAQQDSIKVTIDFNANPWGYAVAVPKGTSYSKPDQDESPAKAWLSKTTDFEVEVADGKKAVLTVTPSDLDEVDYDNCLFYTYDYDVDMSGETRMNVLRMAIGATMTFTAPEGYRFAKVEFNTFRNWSSGGIGSMGYTWGPDSAKVYQNFDQNGKLIWEVEAWKGDDKCWSTPACTGTTMLRYITLYLLPSDASSVVALKKEEEATPAYSLTGSLVGESYKGIIIKNGKKLLRK